MLRWYLSSPSAHVRSTLLYLLTLTVVKNVLMTGIHLTAPNVA